MMDPHNRYTRNRTTRISVHHEPQGWFTKGRYKNNDEEGPNNEKPAVKNRHFEEPTLNNLNHIYELYEESGSDNENMEEILKGENKKNSKERSYTNMHKGKEGKQANLLSKEKPRNHHDIPKKGGNEKALVAKEMALSNLGKNIL